jgi:DNA helicase-2/ATP-dependent DNA helicase PcrA
MLGYLRLIQNPDDEAAFRRVVNSPSRGIGRKTLEHVAAASARQGTNLLQAAAIAPQIASLSPRAVKSLEKFSRLIDELANSATGSVEELLRNIITRSGYREQLEQSGTEQDLERVENVEELVTAARQYDETFGEEATLEGFLEAASLVSDLDALSNEGGQVTLMTLHSAKGLEFPVVFVLAVEENLIPHERSIRAEDPLELEEERRLLFVGMTRAEERLYLTHTQLRDFRGQRMISIPSSFLRETEFVTRDIPLSDEQSTNEVPDYDDESGSEFAEETAELGEVLPKRSSKSAVPAKPLRLMTGADLLSDGESSSTSAPQLPVGFAIGMTVRHPRYGLGTVVNLGGFAKRRTVTVEFRDGGHSETFIAAKCPLQPVGIR